MGTVLWVVPRQISVGYCSMATARGMHHGRGKGLAHGVVHMACPMTFHNVIRYSIDQWPIQKWYTPTETWIRPGFCSRRSHNHLSPPPPGGEGALVILGRVSRRQCSGQGWVLILAICRQNSTCYTHQARLVAYFPLRAVLTYVNTVPRPLLPSPDLQHDSDKYF